MNNAIEASSRKVLTLSAVAVAVAVAAALLLVSPAQAQTIYRVVGPDGKVSFSDKPPLTADKTTATVSAGQPGDGAGAGLPFALREVSSRYPVTLYTSNNCAPCGAGRALLNGRGIPFTEKTVNTADDAEALQRISSDNSLPFLTIGGQQIKGYSDSEWTQFLNAAGYPPTSMLPAGYRNPVATPLVVVQKPAPAAPRDESPSPRTPAEPNRPPADNGSNPAGIKF